MTICLAKMFSVMSKIFPVMSKLFPAMSKIFPIKDYAIKNSSKRVTKKTYKGKIQNMFENTFLQILFFL